MTGTTDDKIVVTMDDLVASSANRDEMKGTYVPVTMQLELYLMNIMYRMVKARDKTDLFAILHTLLEIGIQAGVDAERRRIHDAITAATVVE